MLGKLIFDQELPKDRLAVLTPELGTSWLELREQSEHFVRVHTLLRERRVGLVVSPSARSYAALAAVDKMSCDSFLLDSNLPLEDAKSLARRLRLGALLVQSPAPSGWDIHRFADEQPWSGGSTLTILSSGSTGTPKAARHSWESISRPVRRTGGTASPWLLTYRPNLYAGLQVMLQCFSDYGTLVAPRPEMDMESTVRFMSESSVQFVSATPSYWRRLLMFVNSEILKTVPLRQITLGGEVIDQPILDKLKQVFPQARLVHIYATTELGRCFSVSDGRAGFPVSYLEERFPDGTEMMVSDGELQVRSKNSMKMYDPLSGQNQSTSDWFATGDMVEVRDDRVHFVGRKTEMINVGGSKVFPIEVECVIRAIPGVSDVRVFGKASSIVGELVTCEIVPSADTNPEILKDLVVKTCREQLRSHQLPRIIKMVKRIELSSAGKTLRSKTS
jgi:acyl-CoA synthetase (AMP-forming)/AMP-acid ligase II